ncbi:MAG: VWA domain-containing protein [Myxococcota bacterium]
MKPRERWQLVLGEAGSEALGEAQGEVGAMDAALQWLYGRDAEGEAPSDERGANDAPSIMSVPDWLDQVHTLFPKETLERLEQDAVERYGIDEIVTNPEVLERVEPNETLLAAVLKTKHLMNQELLAIARQLIAKVVRQLMEALLREVRSSFLGALDRRRRSPLKVARNLDFRSTLRRNLKHYDPASRRLLVEKAFFHSRTKRHSDRWQVIILVDQSGSMADSVIHSAVTAACLYGLPGIRTHLCAFDSDVVDLTDEITDPVETLMKVQLGGGTDIHRAVRYGETLIAAPRRTIFVIISDFFEGGSEFGLIQRVRSLVSQGVHVLALGALSRDAYPAWNVELAGALSATGAHAGAMTPGELARFIAEKVRG